MAKPRETSTSVSPFRLLILSPASRAPGSDGVTSLVAPVLTALTGSSPTNEQIATGFAGYTTHAPLLLKTKYYDASVGIWCDEVGGEWKETMADSVEEAREVRGAIGGIVFVLSVKDVGNKEEIARVLDVVEQIEEVRALCEDEGDGRDVVGVAILVGEGAEEKVDGVEEMLRGERGVFGWDVVGWDGTDEPAEGRNTKNDYGEKVGAERVKEILEVVPWTTSAGGAEADFLDSDNDIDWTTSEQRELDREMMGLKLDLQKGEESNEINSETFGEDEWPELQNGSEDVKVERLQGLMERLIATREAASELSGLEKQRFAKREVERIMKEMG